MAVKNKRPRIDKSISLRVQELIKESWDPNPNKRPSFERLSQLLKVEYDGILNNNEPGKLSRSMHLMDTSVRSFEDILMSKLEGRSSKKGGTSKKKVAMEF